jgi:predicted RND superfamily exporter protein
MKSFFSQRDPWGHGLALWVVVALVFLGPMAVSSLRSLRLQNNVADWLPEDDPQARMYRWCREQFPQKEAVILTWNGSTLDDPRLPLLVGRLQGKINEDGIRRGGLPYVETVIHGRKLLEKMVSLGVEEEEAVRRLTGNLLGLGSLKVELTASGREERARTIRDLQQHLSKKLGQPVEVLDPAQAWQPSASNEALLQQALAQYADPETTDEAEVEAGLSLNIIPEHDFQFRWDGMAAQPEQIQLATEALLNYRGFATAAEPEGRQLVARCFQAAGSPLGVVVILSGAGEADKRNALAAIRQAAEHSLIPADQLWLGGSVVAESELNRGVQRAVWNPEAGWEQWYRISVIGFSGLAGIAFSLISLKSLRLGVLVVFISYYAALLGLSLIPLTGGTMNMVLIVLPTLLMVLALSGAIHLANYWKHAVWEDASTAVVKATEMARIPCLMAAFTTAIGFISLCTSDLQPVRDFGLYAAAGSVIAVFMVLLGLPSLLMMCPLRRVRPEEVHPQRWLGFGAFICTWRKPVLATCLGVSALCMVGLLWFRTETRVIRYFPDQSQLVTDYRQIENSLTGITPFEVIVSFNRESQTNYRFLERLEIVREVEERLRQHPQIRGALSLAAFQPEREIPGPDAAPRERVVFNRRSNETEKRIKSGEDASAGGFLVTLTGDEKTSQLEGWSEPGAELWRLTAQTSALADRNPSALIEELDASVREVIRYYPGTNHIVTGTVPVFNRTQQAVLESLIVSFGLAFLLIGAVMSYVLRDVVAGALSMLPNMLPVLSIFGLVSWLGVKIDVGSMVTASVALGIAVDGSLHLLTWFRDGLRKGQSREKAVMNALAHCGPALWQTSAAVGLGLLVLIPADLLLISRFGWLMAALIGAALLGDLFLLPAMLVGGLGKLIADRIVQQGPPPSVPLDDNSNPVSTVPAPHIAIPVIRDRSRQVG